MTEASGGQSPRPRLGVVAVVLAASVFLSRVMGYLREAALAYQVGAGEATDAFYASFQLPDLMNYFLAGGAFALAFLPLYTERRTQGDESGAQALFSVVLGTMGTIAVVVTVILWWYADALIAVQFPKFDPETHELTVRLTRIVLPAQVFFIAGGVMRGVLMAHGSFSAQALAPLIYNGGIIVGGLGFGARYGVEGFAWGALVGAFLGAFLIPLLQVGSRIALRVRFAPFDPAFLRFLAFAAPLMLGVTLLTVDEWYERWFGGLVAAGAIAQLGFARKLMQVPVAVVGQALATAALPTLSRLHGEGKNREFDEVLLGTLRAGGGLAVLLSSFFAVAPAPIVELVYRRGQFDTTAAEAVSAILAVLALAVPAWIIQQIAVRGFYGRSDTWRPMLLGTFVTLASIPLYLRLGRDHGAVGLAAAGAIAMSIGTLLTVVALRIIHGGPTLRGLLSTLLRSGLIALAAGAAAHFAQAGSFVGHIEAIYELVRAGTAFAVVAMIGLWLLGDEPMRQAASAPFARLLRKLGLGASGRDV